MARTRRHRTKSPIRQAEETLEQRIKRLRKDARKAMQQAGKNVRDVRRDVKALQKAGVASRRIDVKHYQPSKYMVKRAVKFADVISGRMMAVPVPKETREFYKEKGILETRGRFAIVPREYEGQTADIEQGYVRLSRRLKNGEEQRIILPFKATDMHDVARQLREHGELDNLIIGDGDRFGFRLFGHNTEQSFGFPDMEMLADYIDTRYQHLFKGRSGREAVKYFQLIRYKSDRGLHRLPQSEMIYHPRKHKKQSKYDFVEAKRLQRDALRKQIERKAETEEKRKRRLEQQRIRSAQNRQRKFEEK